MTVPVFEVHNVTYRYPEEHALDGLSLTIHQGQRIVFMGANGSGKSTLLRLLDALYFAESGSVKFCGETLTEERLQNDEFAFQFRRRVGFVFQNPDAQLFNPTVFDELAFGPLQMRWPKQVIISRINETLDRMEIAHLKARAPHRLSGGEKKRVALASTLILDPEVLLLDEPTDTLDPKSQSHIIDMLAPQGGGTKTVVTATHDLDIIEDIADYGFIFQAGKVIAEGPPADLLRDDALLRRTNLIHAHRRRRESCEIHTHSHLRFGHQR
ncbi:MAG: ABC transporter ATP-binding protein [Chloracidobacterium sp.]|nr:ABC transporter ATP-binding protein [Chloracidobacterium sp.]